MGRLDIDAVTVRMRCSATRYGFPLCADEKCEKCKGTGYFTTDMPWSQFVSAVREEMDPGPDSR